MCTRTTNPFMPRRNLKAGDLIQVVYSVSLIIFIEGESEEKVIPAWVKRKSGIPLVPPFAIVERMGTVGSKARNQAKHWDSLLKNLRIPALFFFDEVEQNLLRDIHTTYNVPKENLQMLRGDIEDNYPIESILDFLFEKFNVDSELRSELFSELKKSKKRIKTINRIIHEHGDHDPGRGAWKVELADYIANESEISPELEPIVDWIIEFIVERNNLDPTRYSNP